MAGEGRVHARLLADLADLLQSAGFGITRLDCRGSAQPPTYEGHRPDLLAERLMMRAALIGEVKVGPDLRAARTFSQFRAFSRVLVPTSPITFAGLVVAVPGPWVGDAWLALAEAGARLTKTLVVGQWDTEWAITFPPKAGAASWRAYGPSIRVPSWPSGTRSTKQASAAGDATSSFFLDGLT